MVSQLSRAIARLAKHFNGQVILELPDELDPEFLREIATTANKEIDSDAEFAWLLIDSRKDLRPFKQSCGLRELAALREDKRLVVCYASDNRGMSTYTTVFAPLFGPEFPTTHSNDGGRRTAGIAGLPDLARTLGACIKETCESEILLEEITAATESILSLLADSYRREGNTASSWVSQWWLHIAAWSGDLVDAMKASRESKNGMELLSLAFGVAGLPIPDSGPIYKEKMRQDYFRVLAEKWSSAPSIRDELARLARRAAVGEAAKHLLEISWEDELASSIDGGTSWIRTVTSAGRRSNKAQRFRGWAGITESEFLSSRVDSQKLTLLHAGKPLESVWPDVKVFEVLPQELISHDPPRLLCEDLTFQIPLLDDKANAILNLDRRNCGKLVSIEFSPGRVERFEIESIHTEDGYLAIKAALEVSLTTWSGRAVRIQLTCRDRVAEVVGDQVSARFYLVGPCSAIALYRKSGALRRPGRVKSEHNIPGDIDVEPTIIQIDDSGLYEVAVVVGADLREGMNQWEIVPQRNGSDLVPTATASWIAKCDSRPIEDRDAVKWGGDEIFAFRARTVSERPLSPLIAACLGVRPSVDTHSELRDKCLGRFEEIIVDALRKVEGDESSSCLGHVLLTTSDNRHDVTLTDGDYYVSQCLRNTEHQKSPPPPSQEFKELIEYRRLIEAYRRVGLAKWIARTEQEEESQGLLLSRVSLREISWEEIEKLLTCYVDLIAAADKLASATDGFWARFPMSIVVYPDSRARPGCESVFMSPAHPIRLAWLWKLETAFAVVREETGQPPAYAHLSEGWTYPWIAALRQRFGQPAALISVPCDSGPDQLFIGWAALVRLAGTEGQELRAPPVVNGLRFPAGASSGLTDGAVEGALRAFVRVFPHVRSLVVELPAFDETQRSTGVDTALGTAFNHLTSGEERQWCLPGGLRVRDSFQRLGPIPLRDEFLYRDSRGTDMRKMEWTRFDASHPDENANMRVHVRLIESQTSHLTAANVGEQRAAFPVIPLRRFPRRIRDEAGIVIDPSFGESAKKDAFAEAVRSCESVPQMRPFAMLVAPGASFVDLETADWTVTGDAGLDPAVLQRIAIGNSSRHMLWEWRPAVAIPGALRLEQRPFVTISRIPEALSASLREKVLLLLPASEQKTVADCVDSAIQALAQRGIGLNSLLAMGHHHATGALGFFFALRLLSHWSDEHATNETRLVVPVDAIDAFLRSIADKQPTKIESTRLADLLAISCLREAGTTVIRLIPVEIKHYGLTDDEVLDHFPSADESRLAVHVEQLTQYTKLLEGLQRLRESSSEVHGRLVDTAIGAVIDAATLLDPLLQGGSDPVAQRALAEGSVKIRVCPGVLLWFQKGGSRRDGVGAKWVAADDDVVTHAKVFIDPEKCWREMWKSEVAEASAAVSSSLDWCLAKAISAGETAISETTREARDIGKVDNSDITAGVDGDQLSHHVATVNPGQVRPKSESQTVPKTESGVSRTHDRSLTDLGVQSEPNEVVRTSAMPNAASHDVTRMMADTQHRGLGKVELERRYRVVLKTFEEFKVQVHPPEAEADRYTEGPASIVFNVRPGFGVAVGRIEAQLENLKLRLQLDANAKIGCKTHLGLVQLDVPKADSERYYVDAESVWTRWTRPERGFVVPIGEDRYGSIVSIDWADSNSPHLLLGGQTGSGKSVALMSLLMGATKFYSSEELRLVLVDPKRVELSSFDGSDYLLDGSLLSEPTDAVRALEEAVIEMEARYATFSKAGAGITKLDSYNRRVDIQRRLPRWLIVLDEYADLTHDPKAKMAIETNLTRLAQKARAAGIHVLVSTQKPVVDVISTVVRGNLPAQLALRVRSAAESSVIIGESGAEKLTGKGDALLKIGGVVTRLQCASVDLD